ncbi:MAG: nucleotide exchange factor GrpE [Puniceicoccales bacterium]|jgi:molecular chaperone GrpE|nr:nucleotide exchange factor GrpE [Puniceicoccales bacterium]
MAGEFSSNDGGVSPEFAPMCPDGEFAWNENLSDGVDGQRDGTTEDSMDALPGELYGKAVGELAESLKKSQREAEGYRDAMVRTMADFENYKKRTQKERTEIRNGAITEVIEVLLPVLDSFEFGLAAAEQHGNRDIVDGFTMILTNFKSSLAPYGLREVFPLHEKFDVNFHECVHRVIDNEAEPDTISSVHRKGYKLNDRLLRPAAVAVSYREEQANAPE